MFFDTLLTSDGYSPVFTYGPEEMKQYVQEHEKKLIEQKKLVYHGSTNQVLTIEQYLTQKF